MRTPPATAPLLSVYMSPFLHLCYHEGTFMMLLNVNIDARVSARKEYTALQNFFLKYTNDEYDHFLCFFGH